MPNWGAFAGGIAEGYDKAERLRIQDEAAEREKEEFAQKKKDWARQDAMHVAIDAAGNTIAPDADSTQFLSADDYTSKFKEAPKKSGLGAWVDRNFSSGPAKQGMPTAATMDAEGAPVPKVSKADYAPVQREDGSTVYVPRKYVKKQEGVDFYDSVARSIAPFDPVQALAMKNGVQQYKSGEYKLKAQQVEEGVLSAARKWTTDPQAALDDITKLHQVIPDGQQVKLTYDPKTGKIQSQFLAETAKGLMPLGKPQTVTFEDITKQALSFASPEGYWKNLEMTYNHTHQMATQMNQKAQLALDSSRLQLALRADKRDAEYQASRNDYLRTRTKALEGKVGEGWDPVVRDNPDGGAPLTGRSNAKTGEVQWTDNEWGKPVKPRFLGKFAQITEAAQSKGLMAKVGADGDVYYINPKTNIASTNINTALKGTPQTPRNTNPANGTAQVPPPTD